MTSNALNPWALATISIVNRCSQPKGVNRYPWHASHWAKNCVFYREAVRESLYSSRWLQPDPTASYAISRRVHRINGRPAKCPAGHP